MRIELPKYDTKSVGSWASATRTPSAYEKLNRRGSREGLACSTLGMGESKYKYEVFECESEWE